MDKGVLKEQSFEEERERRNGRRNVKGGLIHSVDDTTEIKDHSKGVGMGRRDSTMRENDRK